MSELIVSTASRMNEIRFIFVKHMNNLITKNKNIKYQKDIKLGVFEAEITQRYDYFLEDVIQKMKGQSLESIENYMQDFIQREASSIRYSISPQQRTKRFSKDTLEILENSYIVNEYPTDDEKVRIAKRCKITAKQVSNWFTNKRNRSKNHTKRMF